MLHRVDHHDADVIARARAALAAADPALAVADAATPPFAWRLRPKGFSGLVKLVVEQQISVASAAATWKRFEDGLGDVTPQAVLAHDVEALKRFGFSAPKARYAHAIAEAHIGGHVDLEALGDLDDEAAIAALVSLKGVGRWTAETYLLMNESRIDVFPGGDIALQEALRIADGAAVRPTEKELYVRAEGWRPYRGVATHLLWAYYVGLKAGEIPMPAPAGPAS